MKKVVVPAIGLLLSILFTIYGKNIFPELGENPIPQPYLTFKYVALILCYLFGASLLNKLIRIIFWDRLGKDSQSSEVPQLLKDILGGLVYLITLALILSNVFNLPLTGFWATSSAGALVIGFALRNMILDLFTGLAINIEKPYKVGDWIEIHSALEQRDVIGQVIEINWRATHLQTEEAKTIIVPNSLITTFIVTNYWKDDHSCRFEIFIPIDFSIPVERARRVLYTSVKRAMKETGFVDYKEPKILIHEVDDKGLIFKVTYWITPWNVLTPAIGRDRIYTYIMEHLNKAGISIAYPKQDVYYSEIPKRNFIDDTLEDRIKILKKIDLFVQMNEEELNAIAQKIEYNYYDEKETIMTVGETGESMFVMIEGLVEVLIKSGESEIKVAELFTNQYFGEMSLLTGEKRSATVKTVIPSVLYEIKKNDIKELFNSRPKLIEKVAESMAVRKLSNEEVLSEMDKKGSKVSLEDNQSSLIRKIRSFFKVAE
jgi:small-conductance mechanosensitive channel/CRP-like cAMP-binding protein